MNRMKKYNRTILATAILLALSSPLLADRVNYDGLEYPDATVNGYQNGGLSVTVKAGNKLWDLAKIKWIDLDATPKMRQAEELRDNTPKAAAQIYKDAIHAIDDHDLKLLAELRAIAPTDADGKWLDALTYFLDIYQANPTPDVWKLRPTHFPAGSSTMLPDTAAMIDRRLPSFQSDDTKKNLKTFQLELYTKSNDPRADALARELSGISAEPSKKSDPAPLTDDALTAPIESALKSKDFAAAITQADNALPAASDTLAIKLYQLKARAYEAQNNLDEAAATLLRIPSYFPSSPEAPAALLVAADFQKRQNHPDEAKRLYKEIIEKYPDSPAAIRAKGG
jgi:tetratricopeptide (TPR) repeat protein